MSERSGSGGREGCPPAFFCVRGSRRPSLNPAPRSRALSSFIRRAWESAALALCSRPSLLSPSISGSDRTRFLDPTPARAPPGKHTRGASERAKRLLVSFHFPFPPLFRGVPRPCVYPYRRGRGGEGGAHQQARRQTLNRRVAAFFFSTATPLPTCLAGTKKNSSFFFSPCFFHSPHQGMLAHAPLSR